MRRVSDTGSGKGHGLKLSGGTADKASMVVGLQAGTTRAERRRHRQRGQALVEFALIIPLFLMIVVGVIQFGVALNYWLNMQRVANEGARWAVVNAYPGCPRSGPDAPCPSPDPAYPDLLHYTLANSRIAKGEVLEPYICFTSADGTPSSGDSVTVRLTRNYNLLKIVGGGFNFDLNASATMRLEWEPTRYTDDGPCP
jgi:TadE-like protein